MESTSYANLLLVVAAALVAPLLLGCVPGLRLPVAVVEILIGIVIGPSGLRLATIDSTVAVLALLGFAFLLFLAGAEIAFETLGRLIVPAILSFAISLGLAMLVGYGFQALGLISTPLFIAIALAATALGIVVSVLAGVSQTHTTFGQLVIAGASVADFGTVILLTLFFSRQESGTGVQLLLVGELALLAVVVMLAVRQAELWERLRTFFAGLDTGTAQVRIRAALLLLVGFAALAERLGLEVILGAFLAGAILTLVDREGSIGHEAFRQKLSGIGYGVFIPIFFVASGMRFSVGALLGDRASLLLVPLLLAALLLVRGLPALLYRSLLGGRRAIAAGLLQATSLPFILAAVQIGTDQHLIGQAVGAALIFAGLLSVLLFPLAAVALLPALAASDATADAVRGGAAGALTEGERRWIVSEASAP